MPSGTNGAPEGDAGGASDKKKSDVIDAEFEETS
jgi:hypothetical protein